MTLLVAGIMLGLGVPNVLEFQRNAAMTAAANDLITGALMARTEAVKRQAPVTLCLSDDPTAADPVCLASLANVQDEDVGFIVFVDDNDNFNADGSRNLGDASDGNGARDAGELVLMQSASPGGSIRASANCGFVTYAPTGFALQAGGPCVAPTRSILYCDDRGRRVAAGSLSSARVVQIDRPGRAQVLTETAAIDPLIGALGATCP